MPSFFKKLKGAFQSPEPSRKAKSTGDLNYLSQQYIVKDKDLSKLHLAAWKGNLDKVTELCQADKINKPDKEGRTPLHLAVSANHYEVVEKLLSEDAKLQVFDRDNRSPLHIAAINGNGKIMELLVKNLQQKSLLTAKDKTGSTVLFYVLKNPNESFILQFLLENNLVNFSEKDKEQNSPLHFAIIQKNYNSIGLLLEHGADIDSRNIDGRTPLMLACLAGDDKVIQTLLEFEPDLSIKDKSGKTANDWAVLSQNQKCIQILSEGQVAVRKEPQSGEMSLATDNGRKKFENLFAIKSAGGQQTVSKQKTNDADGQSNTSRVLSEEKMVFKNERKNTEDEHENDSWNDSEEVEEDEIIIDEREEPLNKSRNEKNFENIFTSIRPGESEEKKNHVIGALIEDNIFLDENSWNDLPSPMNKKQPTFNTFLSGNGNNKLNHKDSDGNWLIYVYTSNVKNAGTDANVHIQIFGSKSATGLIQLESKTNENDKNLFEAGSCDCFDRSLPDIGRPDKIKIGHDSKGMFAGWHLDKVVLVNKINNESFLFKCGRWLAKDELDHQTEIEIKVDESNKNKDSKMKIKEQSVSSWNSSGEDEDSYNPGFKKNNNTNAASNKASNLLNQIDEEKFNETTGSKQSKNSNEAFQNFNSKSKTSFKNDGPPRISDQEEESGDENLTGANFIPENNALQFLVKNSLPKNQPPPPPPNNKAQPKNETISQLFNKNMQTPAEKKGNTSINQLLKNELQNKPKPIINDFSDYDEKSESIGALIHTVDNLLGDKKPKLAKKEEKEDSSISMILKGNFASHRNPPPPGFGNQSVTSSPPTSARSDTSKFGSLSLAERIRQNKMPASNNNNFDDDNSESDFKSQSIGALAKTVDNILEPKQSNLESFLRNNRPPSGFGNERADEDGLSDLLQDEFKAKANMFLMQSGKSTSSAPGLKDLLKDEFNKSGGNMFVNSSVNKPEKSTSPTRSIKSLISSNVKIPEATNTPGLNELLRDNLKKNKLELAENRVDKVVEHNSELVRNSYKNGRNDLFNSQVIDIEDDEDDDDNESGEDMSARSENKGLSTLLKEEFKANKNEFFGGSPSPPKPGLSALVKEEFKTDKNEFFGSSSPSHKTSQGLTSLLRNEFKETKNEFFGSSISNNNKQEKNSPIKQSPSTNRKGLSNLVAEEFKSNKNEFFGSSMPEKKETTKNSYGINSGFSMLAQHEYKNSSSSMLEKEKTGMSPLTNRKGLSDLVRDEFKTNKNEFFGTSQTSAKEENNYGISQLVKTNVKFNNANVQLYKNESDYDRLSDDENELVVDKLSTSGTIGTAIGTAIGNTLVTTTIHNSPSKSTLKNNENELRQSKGTFATLGQELYNVTTHSIDETNDSNFQIKLQLKLKQDEIESFKQQVNDMLKKYNDLATKTQTLESQKNEAELQKKKFEDLFLRTDRNLAEKEKQLDDLEKRKLTIGAISSTETTEIKTLHKQILELKDTNKTLESKIGYLKINPGEAGLENGHLILIDENESLKNKIKILEEKIKEMERDRTQLSELKEELSLKLEESETKVRLRNEALCRVEIQSKLEKKVLVEENSKDKNDLKQMNEKIDRFNFEINDLKQKLNEKTLKYEKLNIEKLSMEKELVKEKDDLEKRRWSVDKEIVQLRDECGKLKETLSKTEAKLEVVENEAKFTKQQILEREKVINELKSELSKQKREFETHMDVYRKEKEEKEKLIKQCEQLKDEISRNMEEIRNMQNQQQLDVNENGWNNRGLRSLPPRPQSSQMHQNSPPPPANYYPTAQNNNNNFEVEKENQILKSELDSVKEKLSRKEEELFRLKERKSSERINNSQTNSRIFDRVESIEVEEKSPASIESNKIKADLHEIKKGMNQLFEKMNIYENSKNDFSDQNNQNKSQSFYVKPAKQENPLQQVDISGLINDLPLKTIANLSTFMLNDLILRQSKASENIHILSNHSPTSPSQMSVGNKDEHSGHLVTRDNTNQNLMSPMAESYLSPHHHLLNSSSLCYKCLHEDRSYLDRLKLEQGKRIELVVAKELPLGKPSYSTKKLNNTGKLLDNLNENLYRTYKTDNFNSFDSVYNTMNSSRSSNDLMNSLRARFLI